MTQKVKEIAPVIWEAIQKSNNILLHFHPSPDPDVVGSSLALYQVLEGLGKKVTVIKGDSELPSWVKELPCSDKILGKSYEEINPQEFDLFIINDSSTPDMVSQRGEVKFPESMTTVVIDHHASNKDFGMINLVDDSYIANCEIIYNLLKEWGVEISEGVATCLMLGLYTDSGGFKYPKTDDQSFLAASELAKIAPNYFRTILNFENSNDPQRIKFLGLALNSIKLYFNGRVAIAEVSYEDLKRANLEEKDSAKSGLGNYLISVVGWDLGIAFLETEKGKVGLSFRTRNSGEFDLTKIALEFGGGGHKGAAGATIKKSFDEAKKELLEKLSQVYPGLGQP